MSKDDYYDIVKPKAFMGVGLEECVDPVYVSYIRNLEGDENSYRGVILGFFISVSFWYIVIQSKPSSRLPVIILLLLRFYNFPLFVIKKSQSRFTW